MEFIFVAATKSHKTCDCDADITTVGSVTGLLDGRDVGKEVEMGEQADIVPKFLVDTVDKQLA